jgi:aspartyl protease family protein
MSNANGPWERKPPRFAQRHTRLLVWIAIALAITAVLLELSRLFPNALGSDIDLAYFVNCVVFLALVSAGVVMGRRFTTRETLRNAVIWVGIFALCVIGYTFRDNLEAVGTKIRGELIPSYPIASGRSITLIASEGGSFYTMGTIDGTNAMFLIDTGASDIVLSPADAQRAGIDISQLDFSQPFETAHGSGRGASIAIDQLSIGPITLRNVRATVNQSPMRTSLLGITFLQSLESFEIRGNKLTLRWRQ